MASLVKWLHFSGARDETGAPISSGNAYFWQAGSTSVPVSIYADAGGANPITHPVALDAAGRAEVYVVSDCEIVIKDAAGATKRLSTDAESTKAEQVYVTWGSIQQTLAAALANIEANLAALTASPPPDTRVTTTIPTASPVFTFNQNFRVNVFKATYAGAMGTITVNWPTTPTLAKGTWYRIFIQTGSGTATTVSFDGHFTHSWGQAGSPTTLAANTYYTAMFIVDEAQTNLYQVTSWWPYGGTPW